MSTGIAITIGSPQALAQALALNDQVTLLLLSRSVTTLFTMGTSRGLDGVPELITIFVMITGVFGAVIGGTSLHAPRLRTPLARNALFGVDTYGADTNRAYELSNERGPATGLLTVPTGPFDLLVTPLVTRCL